MRVLTKPSTDFSSKTWTGLWLFSLRVSFCCSGGWFRTPEEIGSRGHCGGSPIVEAFDVIVQCAQTPEVESNGTRSTPR